MTDWIGSAGKFIREVDLGLGKVDNQAVVILCHWYPLIESFLRASAGSGCSSVAAAARNALRSSSVIRAIAPPMKHVFDRPN
jgi:hypothetical protein